MIIDYLGLIVIHEPAYLHLVKNFSTCSTLIELPFYCIPGGLGTNTSSLRNVIEIHNQDKVTTHLMILMR